MGVGLGGPGVCCGIMGARDDRGDRGEFRGSEGQVQGSGKTTTI